MKFHLRNVLCLALLLCGGIPLSCQTWSNGQGWGGRLGLTLGLGTHVNRLGLVANMYYYQDWWQVNLEVRQHYNFRQLGPPAPSWEFQSGLGFLAGFGPARFDADRPMVHPSLPQFSKQYSLGYTWYHYLDRVGTSQGSGAFGIQLDRWHLLVENDAFSPIRPDDNFRTGAIGLYFHAGEWLFEWKSVMWHGRSNGPEAETVRNSDYPCRWGYRDITSCQFGEFSHGIMAMQVHVALNGGQTGQLGLGIDSERVRNFFQNKLIHDMWFFPPSWTPVRNLHFPMLNEEGELYLFEPDKRIRPDAFFFQLGLNNGRFY